MKAKIIENQKIGDVLLMLKMTNEINFQTLKMTDKMNGFYEALVPGTFLLENAVLNYYISACDTQNNCETSGSSETPYQMKVISLEPRTEGFVLEVQKKKTVISIGSMDGVSKGDKYIVFRTGKEFRDPKTNELLQIEEILVGTLEIKELMPKTAYASISDSFVPLEENDRIRKQVSSPREFITENSHSAKIILRWSPNPEPEVEGYYIYRAEKIDGNYRKITMISNRDNTYFEDTQNMKEGLTFYYRITAFNMLETEGITSVPIIGRTKGRIPPPSDFRTDGMRVREVSLSWTALQNDPDLEQYVIFRSETEHGNFSEIARTRKNTNNYSDRGKLQDGKVHYYKIASYSRNGSIGEQSAAVTGKTKGPPSPPENIRAESGAARNIKLQWNRHSDSDVAGYIIYRSEHENGNFMETGKSNNTGHLDKDLPDGKMYYYKVASYFSSGREKIKGQPSVPVSATTKHRPKQPADVVAESGLPKKVHIKWNTNEEKDISEYWIYRGADDKLDNSPYAKVKPDVSSFTDNDLNNNTAYSYAVRAVDADELESDLSNMARAVTKPLPSSPAGFKGEVKEGKLLLYWTPNPEQDIKVYNVYKKKWFGKSILLSPESNSCEITPEENEKSIELYITAVDRDDLESGPSEVIEVILKQ
jgi:fibronectin type 3 domain-containing protein